MLHSHLVLRQPEERQSSIVASLLLSLSSFEAPPSLSPSLARFPSCLAVPFCSAAVESCTRRRLDVSSSSVFGPLHSWTTPGPPPLLVLLVHPLVLNDLHDALVPL